MTTSDRFVLFGGDVALWIDDGAIMLQTFEAHGEAVSLNAEQAARLSRLLHQLANKMTQEPK